MKNSAYSRIENSVLTVVLLSLIFTAAVSAKHPSTATNQGQSNKIIADSNKLSQDDIETFALVSKKKYSFQELIVLNRLFNQNPEKGVDLGDVMILDKIFNGHGVLEKDLSLGDYYVLDALFRTNSGFLHKDKMELGDLLILEILFDQ